MKKRELAIFLTIFLSIFGSVNYYIFIRGYQGLEAMPAIRPLYTIAFISVAASYLIAKMLEQKMNNIVTDILFWIGSFWFGYVLYFLLSIILLDVLRLTNNIFSIIQFSQSGYSDLKLWVTLGVIGGTTLALLLGYINANTIKIKRFDLPINKHNPITKQLTVVMASDIHLGTIVGRPHTRRIVEAINSLNPDIILLAGDIIDSEVESVVRQDLGAVLKELKSTYGVYGVTGNHEYFGGIEEAVHYIRAHRVDLLRDDEREIAGVVVIGREDYTIKHHRKSLETMLAGVDKSKPIIVIDHQPFHLEEAEAAGVDLQVSGHTHRGQLWPLNYITKKVYEIDWGYLKKGMTHIYVSSGVGTWGPPVKIGNDAEIIEFKLAFL
ncbi:MAG TPA: metallophosphoesterase [Candidatus Kapabacteria bacterium]|nr:metallophosphoesterase [Candidatus Kapabacteria bacterium]